MKKTVKSVLLLIVMAIMVFALTGCGSKVVGTKSEEDSMFGKYTEKVEVKFKSNKADKVVETIKFDNEDKAKLMETGLSVFGSDSDVKIKRSGKKITMTVDAETFFGTKDDLSKDDVKTKLKDMGYEVK